MAARSRAHEAMRTVPSPILTAPGALPVLGHILALWRRPLGLMASLPKHGDVVRIRLGPVDAVVICDPALAFQVLQDDRTFDKGGLLYDRVREGIGNGVASCLHDAHRRQRRLAQPAFHRTRLSGYTEVMAVQIASVLDGWRDGLVLDVVPEMLTISSRVAGSAFFSDTLSPDALHQLYTDIETFNAGIIRRMAMPAPIDRLPLPGNRRYFRACARLRNTANDMIVARRAVGGDRGDLLSALLAAHDAENDSRSMSDTEIIDNLVTFLVGGIKSTAMTLAWALSLVAQHADIERQLHAEVDTVLAGRSAVYADLPRLELTGRLITETLRLWPPNWLFTRTTIADTQLGEYFIPAGTTIVYSAYLVHHNSAVYDDPERFDPDRWLPGHTIPPSAFVAFGRGARKCMGDSFGMAEATLALATIATRWKLEHVPGARVRPARGVVLSPGGLRMRVVARTPPPRGTCTGPDSVPNPLPRDAVTPTVDPQEYQDHNHFRDARF